MRLIGTRVVKKFHSKPAQQTAFSHGEVFEQDAAAPEVLLAGEVGLMNTMIHSGDKPISGNVASLNLRKNAPTFSSILRARSYRRVTPNPAKDRSSYICVVGPISSHVRFMLGGPRRF
jgi:hypothetical protein